MNGIGFWSNIIENHDEPRGVSRYLPEGQCTEMGKKMLALITLCLRGIPFIYQGQEIGMENMEFTSLDQMDDISTLVEYRVAKEAGFSDEEAFRIVSRHSRDNARTPMQWDDSENAGFTEGRPWLPVNPKKDKINVAAQLQSETSVLAFYKKLIALRKDPQYKNVLVYGDFQSCAIPEENLMAYLRTDGEKRLLIVANYQSEPKAVPLEWQVQKVILTNDTELKLEDQTLYLNGYQAAVLEVGSV
jgi:oligo-1,6-glucosidase